MQKLKPDYSLSRDGLSLSEWLWRLVDGDRSVRLAAGEALQAMQWGMPSAHTDFEDVSPFPDTAAQGARFKEGVRSAIADSSFNATDFFDRFVALRLAMSEEWSEWVDEECRRSKDRDERYERLAEKLKAKVASSNDRRRQRQAEERLTRLTAYYIAGACDCEQAPFGDAESVSAAGTAAVMVMHSLGAELMAAPDAVEAMLDCRSLRHEALEAMARAGEAAVPFAARLIDDFDRDKEHRYEVACALGTIASFDPETARALVDRLGDDASSVRTGAAYAISFATGLPAAVDAATGRLLAMLEREDERYAAAPALAAVATDNPEVRARIVAMAGPQPPRMKSYEGVSDLTYDEAMSDRASAIGAMRRLTGYPEECVPVLIEALDSFEEFNPDECYDGPCGRVAGALAVFGPAAAPAVGPLVEHLDDDPDDWPRAIVEALAAIGPAAAASVPALHRLRQERWGDCDLADLSAERVTNLDDPIGWAIQQITEQPAV